MYDGFRPNRERRISAPKKKQKTKRMPFLKYICRWIQHWTEHNVNTVTDEGWTALHYASIRGDEKNHHNVCWNMDAGHILLARGADVNEHSQEDGRTGWTPLHCTALLRQDTVPLPSCNELEMRRLKPSRIISSRPLHLAASEGDTPLTGRTFYRATERTLKRGATRLAK